MYARSAVATRSGCVSKKIHQQYSQLFFGWFRRSTLWPHGLPTSWRTVKYIRRRALKSRSVSGLFGSNSGAGTDVSVAELSSAPLSSLAVKVMGWAAAHSASAFA